MNETFEDVEVWERVLHGTNLTILLLATVAGNSFLLVLVLSHKTLQSRSVLISLSLVAADLLITVAWSIQGLANVIAGSCPFGEVGCTILGALTNIGIYARWCIIALITVERFCKILFPFCYARYSKPLLIILSILCWVIAITTAVIPTLAGAGTFMFRLEYSSCIATCGSNSSDGCLQFYIVLYGLFLSIGGILPMILYFMLCIIGHRKAYKMKHIQLGTFTAAAGESAVGQSSTGGSATREIATATGGENTTTLPKSSKQESTGSEETSSTSRSSSSSWGGALEKKILITFFMIFVNVFVTQLPIYTTSALRSSEETYSKIPIAVHLLFVQIYLLGSVLDPMLIMRNKDFRDVILRMWRRRQAKQRLQQSSISSTLLDFAKVSSLLDVRFAGSRVGARRNSCPSTMQTTFVRKLAKARSLGGSLNEEDEGEDAVSTTPEHTQIRIIEENREDRNGSIQGESISSVDER